MPNNQVAISELASEIWAMEPRRLAAFLAGLADYRIHDKPAGIEEKESKVSGLNLQQKAVVMF